MSWLPEMPEEETAEALGPEPALRDFGEWTEGVTEEPGGARQIQWTGIRWIKTEAGKNMPCDPEKITAWVISPGKAPRIMLVNEDGQIRFGHQVSAITPDAEQIEGYVSHWTTCPRRRT